MEPRLHFVDNSIVFKVTFVCMIGDLQPVTNGIETEVTHLIRGEPKVFNLPEFSYRPQKCKTTLDKKLMPLVGKDFPKFMKYDGKGKQVTLAGDASCFNESGKSYEFKLTVSTADMKSTSEFKFRINTEFKNDKPRFETPIPPKVLDIGTSTSWGLPKVLDNEGD